MQTEHILTKYKTEMAVDKPKSMKKICNDINIQSNYGPCRKHSTSKNEGNA